MPLCLLDLPVQAELEEPILFHCDKCDFRTKSQQGVDLHKVTQHQEQQKPVDEKNNDEQSGIKHFEEKLDGVGPVDNRPSTDKLHHFLQKKEDYI